MKKFKTWISKKVKPSKRSYLRPLNEQVQIRSHQYPLKNGREATVKLAKVSDVTDIVEIEKACYNGETPWNRSALVHEIQYNKNALYLIVHDLFQPIAFVGAWFVRDEAHITNIATIPGYERQGIATYLIEQLVETAAILDVERLTLECRMSNKKAQSLYRNLGFIDGRVKRNYYANDREDALEMIKNLSEICRKSDSYVQIIK